MAGFGERFVEPDDRKIALNFAAPAGYPLEPRLLRKLFSPDRFLIKLTPINPTRTADRSGLVGVIDPDDPGRCRAVAETFRAAGYETIVSIGELAENAIGSNCGMYALAGGRPCPGRPRGRSRSAAAARDLPGRRPYSPV